MGSSPRGGPSMMGFERPLVLIIYVFLSFFAFLFPPISPLLGALELGFEGRVA